MSRWPLPAVSRVPPPAAHSPRAQEGPPPPPRTHGAPLSSPPLFCWGTEARRSRGGCQKPPRGTGGWARAQASRPCPSSPGETGGPWRPVQNHQHVGVGPGGVPPAHQALPAEVGVRGAPESAAEHAARFGFGGWDPGPQGLRIMCTYPLLVCVGGGRHPGSEGHQGREGECPSPPPPCSGPARPSTGLLGVSSPARAGVGIAPEY